MLLFVVGMFVSQGVKPISLPAEFSGDHIFRRGRLPYFAGFIVQLVFVPVLWTHSSDEAQFFGRFSVTFMPVVIMNIALIAGIPLLTWRVPRLQAFLRKEKKRLLVYILFVIVVALTLFAAPQLRDMHWNAVNFLVATALSMLAVAWWEWTSALADPAEKRCSLLAIASTVTSLMIIAALLTVPRWFVGVGAPRHWSSAAFLLVIQGLIWGFTIGQSIRLPGESGQHWKARLQRASAVVFCHRLRKYRIGSVKIDARFHRVC